MGDQGLISRDDPLEKGKVTQLQYSGLENSMDCIVHGVAESDTIERLSLSLDPNNSYIPFKLDLASP